MTKKEVNFKNVQPFWIKVIVMTFSLLCLISSFANAVWIGQSQLNPFLEIKSTYDSNIYRVPEDVGVDSDIIMIVSPGIHFEYPTRESPTVKIAANYRADIMLYSLDGDAVADADGQLNTVNQRLDGFLYFNFASGIRFNFGSVFTATSNPPDFNGDTRDYFNLHNPTALLAYAFADRYEIELEYDGRFRRYTEEELSINDYNRNGLELDGFYNITPKTALLIGGFYADVDRKDPPFSDSKEYAGYGGARYKATGRTSGIIKIGGLAKDYEDEFYGSESGWYVSGSIESQYSERTFWSIDLDRRIRETSTANNTALYGPYFVQTNLGAYVSHALTSLPNLSLSGSLAYGDDRYPDDPEATNRKDQVFGAGAGIDYKMYRYISLGASYRYTRRDSTVEIHDFTDHLASIYVRGVM